MMAAYKVAAGVLPFVCHRPLARTFSTMALQSIGLLASFRTSAASVKMPGLRLPLGLAALSAISFRQAATLAAFSVLAASFWVR